MAIDEALSVYGDAFLQYVLADDTGEIRETNEGRFRALDYLSQLASEVQRHEHGLVRALTLSSLFSHFEPRQTSVANALRLQSGGSLADVGESGDDASDDLVRLAHDMYPAFLLPEVGDAGATSWPLPLITGPIFHSPVTERLVVAILRDGSLRKLFPGAPQVDAIANDKSAQLSVQSKVILTSGWGGSLQLSMLPSSLLVAGHRLAQLQQAAGLHDFLEIVRSLLNEVRRLAEGREVSVPMLIGIEQVQLDHDASVELSTGTLRRALPIDETILGAMWPEIGRGAVLQVAYPLRIVRCEPWEARSADMPDETFRHWEHHRPEMLRVQQAVDRIIELSQLALLLASDEGNPIGSVIMARAVLDPLRGHPSVTGSLLSRSTSNTIISDSVARRAEEWGAKIVERHPRNLDMGMRRVLRAASTPLEPVDGLVDSVICWENMFGTSEGESTFRICGAMACLLEPDDPTARLQLFKALQRLYGVRSKIVHGAAEPQLRDAVAHRDQALRYALAALRELYDNPALLRATDSAARGRNLLLDTADDLQES